jgi:hypothetical protein
MANGPKSTQRTRGCKIKRVNPAVRSVSTPRCSKDLPVVGPVNPESSTGASYKRSGTSKWGADRLSERLQSCGSEVL